MGEHTALKRDEAEVGQRVCIKIGPEDVPGTITQIQTKRDHYLPRVCSVKVGRKTYTRPETELFTLPEVEA